ncbi:hypothetical protein AAL_00673 [Moelleriella libera RCEF 2490]|uniref:Uncharacterized protein n=1 Tax=Moelleriella libera RCEF 2490 TaxID=1081109 RepID=A0A166V2L0_9HYPO|nr:hypothetical protein AAL_00673 [Moelleriella libera RCEF 2490]
MASASWLQDHHHHHHHHDHNHPPPPLPRAWKWTCHRCLHRYKIAITRRCLSCSHTFCLWRAGAAVNAQLNTSPPPLPSNERPSGRTCDVEFDYYGWSHYLNWRRALLQHEEDKEVATADDGEGGGGDGGIVGDDSQIVKEERSSRRHDCTLDCDYPSQCLHRRYEALSASLPLHAVDVGLREMGLEQAWILLP